MEKKNMGKITKQQYEVALAKVEELLSLVDDSVPVTDSNAVLLTIFSDIIISYEQEHYPIDKPTVSELIEFAIQEKGMTQKQLAGEIGVSPSRVNDYISGRSEPSLKIARLLCKVLGISPEAMLGY
ncbi:DNA-binding helix-turn-helix protein [Tannerella forsythia KS16]|nr:DNA-binding helix-turn-helix protein [Tannerella forsythia KS16]